MWIGEESEPSQRKIEERNGEDRSRLLRMDEIFLGSEKGAKALHFDGN